MIGTYHTVVKGFDDFRNFQLLSETLDKGVLDHVYLSNEGAVQASLVGGYIKLDVTSTYPGIVIYTQNRDSKFRPLNHKDSLSNIHAGIAIEPQYIQGLVPVLRKDMPYKHQIKYAFRIDLNKKRDFLRSLLSFYAIKNVFVYSRHIGLFVRLAC